MIMVLRRIKGVSTFKRSKMDIGQTFRVDPLLISTLTMIISLHFTIMCTGKVWSLPSGGSSTSVKEIWLVANTVETIPSKEDSIALIGTHISFKTFKKPCGEHQRTSTTPRWKSELATCLAAESHCTLSF